MPESVESIVLEHSAARAVASSDGREHRRALILMRTVPCVKELWPIVTALRDRKGFSCMIVVGREVLVDPSIAPEAVRRYASAGFRMIDAAGQDLSRIDPTTVRSPLRPAFAKRYLRHLLTSRAAVWFGITAVFEFASKLRRFRIDRRLAQRLLERERPDVIVIQDCEANLVLDGITAIVAREQGIPTVMVSGGDNGVAPTGRMQTYLINRIADTVDARRFSNRLVAWWRPDWVRSYEGRGMLRYPAAECLAGWCNKLMIGDPWISLPWVARRTVLSERACQDVQRPHRFPEGQLVVTGQAIMDQVHETWQAAVHQRPKILGKFGLDSQRPTVLFSVPPLNLHRLITHEQQLEMTESVMRSVMAIPNAQLLLSLHLGAKRDMYAPLAAIYGAVIAEGIDVRQLVAVTDVFICVRSSVMLSAMACRKPTLAIDWWRMGHVPYYECPGVHLVERPEDLEAWVRKLLTDPQSAQQEAEQLEQAARQWASHFDGYATDRVVAVIAATALEAAQKRTARR